ncbi:MAG TPA: class I SAM-dependent methyltransferase [Terriglobales bacterium]|nr:class I SAM-dependent methyltransferase [Terriglobales bacterium]
MPSQASWDRYFRMIARYAPGAEHQEYAYFRLVEATARPGIAWLDAGCGHTLVPAWLTGSAALEQRLLSLGNPLVGCDIDPPSLAAPSSIRRVACNLEALCFKPNSFDLITCNGVIEHVASPGRAFAQFHAALKPGGQLIVNTPNLRHWSTMIARLTPYWFHRLALARITGMKPEDIFPTLFRANTPRRLQMLLQQSGFAETQVHGHMGRPRLVGMGPLLWLECQAFRVLRKISSRSEFLCAVARKSAHTAVAVSSSR